MGSREVIKELEKGGWYEVNQVGSHKQFRHPEKKAASPSRTRNATFR
jgi:predicted RNA binding protein YcfA (HicA-like mRNA interferase family)